MLSSTLIAHGQRPVVPGPLRLLLLEFHGYPRPISGLKRRPDTAFDVPLRHRVDRVDTVNPQRDRRLLNSAGVGRACVPRAPRKPYARR